MSDSQKWLIIASLSISVWVVYLLLPVLTPFVISAFLAYLFDPLVDQLEKKLSRSISVLIIFALIMLLALGVILVLIPILQSEISTLIRRIPDLVQWLERDFLPQISAMLGTDVNSLDIDSVRNSVQENWRNIGNVAGFLFLQFTSSSQAFIAWLAYFLLIPVVTFYLLRDWDGIMQNIKLLIPDRYKKTTIGLGQECDSVLSEFLRGQFLVMLSLSFIYTAGLWLAGIEYSFLIGLLAGLISFVPYLGSVIGICVAGVVAFFQYHDVIHLVFVALAFGVGQSIEGMLLSPWLVGERIGLHPVAVIFAVMAGGQLFGFTGILLALPVAAILLVLLRFLFEEYQTSEFYS
ncbi:MAG: putative PurR-regulated permease PerM [Gammaproteobacteria bacterium]|jgi:predicted PurR-regulated permease PerM